MTTSDDTTIEESTGGENGKGDSGFRQPLKEHLVPIIVAVGIVGFGLLAIYLFTRKQGAEDTQDTGTEPHLDETEKRLDETAGLDTEAEK